MYNAFVLFGAIMLGVQAWREKRLFLKLAFIILCFAWCYLFVDKIDEVRKNNGFSIRS